MPRKKKKVEAAPTPPNLEVPPAPPNFSGLTIDWVDFDLTNRLADYMHEAVKDKPGAIACAIACLCVVIDNAIKGSENITDQEKIAMHWDVLRFMNHIFQHGYTMPEDVPPAKEKMN